jgi:hypothetical protein
MPNDGSWVNTIADKVFRGNLSAQRKMTAVPPTNLPTPQPLNVQIQQFEATYRSQFDANAWPEFVTQVTAYINDLHVEARREFVQRTETPEGLFSGKDIQRASAKIDFRRHFARRKKKFGLQVGGLLGSILSGITANWCFSDLAKSSRTAEPWLVLTALVAATIVMFAFSLIKDMEN